MYVNASPLFHRDDSDVQIWRRWRLPGSCQLSTISGFTGSTLVDRRQASRTSQLGPGEL